MSTAPARAWGWLLGSGCCGSSLLQELLARHPEVAFLSNVDDLVGSRPGTARFNRRLYRAVPQRLTRKGRVRFAPSEGYRVLARSVSPIVVDPVGPLSASAADPWLVARLRTFFHDRADTQPGSVFVHKFTGHCRAGLLTAAFPGSSFVHVVRDGRAVAASLVRQSWWTRAGGVGQAWATHLPPADREAWELSGRSAPLLAALAWRATVEEHEREQATRPSRWLSLRYEDLLEDPVPTVAAAARHIGLPDSDALTARVGRYRLDTSRREAFRRELGRDSVALLEHAVGGALQRWGYV